MSEAQEGAKREEMPPAEAASETPAAAGEPEKEKDKEEKKDKGDEESKSAQSLEKDESGTVPPDSPSTSSMSITKSTSLKVSQQEPLQPEVMPQDPTVDWRNMRRIIAEDPEWSLAVVPDLTELCIRLIVSRFAENSEVLQDLLPKHQEGVLAKISTDLPLKVTALLVWDQGYWERCCRARWEVCDVQYYGGCWKRMYLERHLQHIIEHYVPCTTDPVQLMESVRLAAPFIKRLEIKQLLPPVRETPKGLELEEGSDAGSDDEGDHDTDHFNFAPVLKELPNLEELYVTYGVRDCGMNFEWTLFQFTARDCLHLAQCCEEYKTLRLLKLHRSKVDDDKVRVIIAHLLDHPGLEELDLSNNLIGDRGARAVGKFLNNHSQVTRLSLLDNQVRVAGAQALAHALTKNTVLTSLNLRLNRLGDEGGQAIFRSLLKNSTLQELNLSSNEIAEPSASILAQVLTSNTALKSIDLSCNKIGPEGGKQLQEGMEENNSIVHMDLRLTDCGQESEYCINLRLHTNNQTARQVAIKEQEASAPPQRNCLDPQAAHRYKMPLMQIW